MPKFYQRAKPKGDKSMMKTNVLHTGTLEVEARRRWVRLRYLGAPVFGTHTWRVLQRGVVETVLQFSGVDSFFIDQEMVDDENLTLTVRW